MIPRLLAPLRRYPLLHDDFTERPRPPANLLASGTTYDLGIYVKRRYAEYMDTLTFTPKIDTVNSRK